MSDDEDQTRRVQRMVADRVTDEMLRKPTSQLTDAEAAILAAALRGQFRDEDRGPDGRSMSDNPFAIRAQARRAAILAAQLRRMWDVLLEEERGEFLLGEAAARLSDEAWINLADTVAATTGKPFHPPSETTKAITIGLLSVPELAAPAGLRGLN